ncbi:amidohydrolase [Candidatus Korarchaeum cryptofilum]|jgi:5-methylthioadenosine/S-adenosylhomocysteine deaminase|uniref:5-methylthioadenosine/S-adenosylhomocysteine deaminase n=1 Tax=Candidatus Korarchaeum cryptofilum TaxID=498846 RepID=A0A3R9RJ50_9CREN|nr:amidohydrolase [Candidatus Korarchaeum cryptofilum]RSN69684.1 amidohydrolase [Candidatus Korarchaeum cryptofilum]
MEILIKGLRFLVTQDDERRILRDKDILIKEGIIEKIGNLRESADEIIDGRDLVAIPGLINTHTHIPMTLFRGVADDIPLFPWLNEKIWPMEANLRPHHIRAGTELGILESVRTGTTTIFDMYFFEDVIAEVFKEFGVRGVLASAIIDFGTPECKNFEECLKIADSFVNKWINDPLILPCYGPHAPYTVSPSNLVEIASRTGSWIQIHVSETEGEVKDIKGKYGKSPVKLIEEVGVLSKRTVLAHLVWPDDEDLPIIANSGSLVSHNPISNLKLSSGIAPVPEMIEKGVRVSLGTDGAASNNSLDMFETMKTAAIIQKARKMDPTVMPAQLILDMATRIPAENLPWRIGRIVEGYEADIVLLNTKVPWWNPLHSVISHLVYSAKSTDVKYVLVKGNLLYDGSFRAKGEEKIYEEAEKSSIDLLEKSGVTSMLNSM